MCMDGFQKKRKKREERQREAAPSMIYHKQFNISFFCVCVTLVTSIFDFFIFRLSGF